MSRIEARILHRAFAERLRFRERALTEGVGLSSRAFAERLRIVRRELSLDSRILTASSPLVRLYGHEFASLRPVLVSGPVATPGVTTANIAWETDIPAYHRVRFKKSGAPSWTETAWTLIPSTIASVDLSGLEGENTAHIYDIQSCAVGDGSAAFDYYPGDNSATFSTLCSGVYGMANWNAEKVTGGKISWLRLSWTTTVTMYQAQINGNPASLDYGPWGSGDTTHEHSFYDFDFSKVGTHYWQTRNRNRCYNWCDYSAWKWFSVNSRGEIYAQG